MDQPDTLNTKLQFHLLRHFVHTDEHYLDEFMKKSVHSPEEIKQQFAMPGSKFHPEFARNPVALWKIIKDRIAGNHFGSRFEGKRKIFSFNFEKEHYPDGIGSSGLIPLSELSQAENDRIEMEDRDGILVQTIQGIKPPATWEMHMVILLTGDPFITTIFPGIYAPPFPDRATQAPGEYEENASFWKTHVLIRPA